jgi:hypothetical protein
MISTRVVVRAATLAVATMIAVAVVVPAAGQALGTKEFPIKFFPKVFSNGVKATTTRKPVIAVGELTLQNPVLGNLKCANVFAGVTYNEATEGTEKGFDSTTGYSTFNCKASIPCPVHNTKGEEVEGDFLTAEAPPEAVSSTEAHPTGITSLPWTGELIERETGIKQVLTHHLKVWFVVPPKTVGIGDGCGGFEVPFEELEGPAATEKGATEAGYELAPVWENGTKNGLKPSHEEFLGEEGLTEKGFPRTGRLTSQAGDGFPTGFKIFTGGLGGGWELITAQ